MDTKELLKKCVRADLSHFDETTNTYHIPKYTKPFYKIGGCYLVTISAEVVRNPNSLTAVNWNGGRAPQVSCMKIAVNKILGKNIYVHGLGYDIPSQTDIEYNWVGWLNTDDLTQLQEL